MSHTGTGSWVTVTAACGAAATAAALYYGYRCGYDAALVDGRRDKPHERQHIVKKPQPFRVSALKGNGAPNDEEVNSPRSPSSPGRPSTPEGRRLWYAPIIPMCTGHTR